MIDPDTIIQGTGTDGDASYDYEYYTILRPYSATLLQEVTDNFPDWLAMTKTEDRRSTDQTVRLTRQRLLMESDYLEMLDYPISDLDRKAVQTYRQALRDMTSQANYPYDIALPLLPAIQPGGDSMFNIIEEMTGGGNSNG
jgi:hypothetical protein